MRSLGVLLHAILATIALGLAGAPFPAVAAAPPNILLIVSEDNGPELGCYGDPVARTPHLDRLAREGVRFERAFVTQAGCSQSRASFLSGLYPHQHGQIGLATWGFRLYRADTPNLVRSLSSAGYRTGIVGKLHVNPESAFPFDYRAIEGANFARHDLSEYARRAEEFITAGDAPFLLSVNFPDAHDPWLRQVDGLPEHPLEGSQVRSLEYFGVDPPALREMVADYYNCLSRLDTCVGQLLALLERLGQADDTIVVYLGDHGADLLRGKRTCYEGGLRVPLIVRWPGRARPQVCQELISTTDLLPTLLAAAGADPLPELPGCSLLPLLDGQRPEWRTYLFAEFHTHGGANNYYPQRAVRDARYKLIENLLPKRINPGYEFTLTKLQQDADERAGGQAVSLADALAHAPPAVRTAYARMQRPPRFELYDLEADPYEWHNLADDPAYAQPLAALRQALDSWRRQTSDPLLDPANLSRLSAEVTSVKKKRRNHPWEYPGYFFR